jgi:hypothetical protein
VNDGTVLYLRSLSAHRAQGTPGHHLDHQIDVAAGSFVVDDPDVFQTHQGLDDLIRVAKDEGAFCFLAHT